jgi:release factor glutamine methyltransferase
VPCIKELLVRGTTLLAQNSINSPALDAALLLADTLNINREKLYTAANRDTSEEQSQRYTELLERRLGGECIAYILGRKEFWGLEFIVSPAVLVPRPDTEILVEAALAKIRQRITRSAVSAASAGAGIRSAEDTARFSLLDLCTGSGAVAIALKHEVTSAKVWASDISAEVLAIARRNAERLLAAAPDSDAVIFIQGNLFAALPGPAAPRFAFITANAPYVPSGGIAHLAPELRREPLLALDGGADGLDLIRQIIAESPSYLEPGGWLLLEADPSHMETITRLMKKRGFWKTERFRDLAGLERVIAGVLPDQAAEDFPEGQ